MTAKQAMQSVFIAVEGDPSVHDSIKMILQDGDYDVRTFTDAAKALPVIRQLASEGTKLVVYTDVPQPGQTNEPDDVPLIREMKNDPALKNIPLIISSAVGEMLAESFKDIQFDKYALLHKPYGPREFRNAVYDAAISRPRVRPRSEQPATPAGRSI